jgi:hypothetical protein
MQTNVFSHTVVNGGWDGMIAHPECTFLTRAGARHMSIPWRREAQMAAVYNVRALWAFPIRLKAIENPVGRLSTLWRKPDQVIQPHMFGHPEFKATAWWLDGLPPSSRPTSLRCPGVRPASGYYGTKYIARALEQIVAPTAAGRFRGSRMRLQTSGDQLRWRSQAAPWHWTSQTQAAPWRHSANSKGVA